MQNERAIVLFNRNLPTHWHKTSLRAFVSWIAGIALSMMLCVYSIGAPIGAGQISREKHYDPFMPGNIKMYTNFLGNCLLLFY